MRGAIFCSLLISAMACQSEEHSRPDVSASKEELSLVRYEQLLFDAEDTSVLRTAFSEHPLFSEVFLQQVVQPAPKENMLQTARRVAADTLGQQLFEIVHGRYSDFSDKKSQFEDALAYYRHYLPEEPMPEIYTCISTFEVGSFTIGPEVMGIGLDFYLGPDFAYDPQLFPEYISRTMTEEHLVAKSMQALIEQRIPPNGGARFIDHLIRNGKVLYLKEKVLPDCSKEIIHEFSSEQMAWVEGNESQIWAFIISENLLYETEERKFRKMISPSPTVPGMPEDAPGRVGNWVGYRIVKAYCERNGVEPAELLDVGDVQIIMAGSKYKPRHYPSL